eukprot:4318392-Prymnesium_polylepis.2
MSQASVSPEPQCPVTFVQSPVSRILVGLASYRGPCRFASAIERRRFAFGTVAGSWRLEKRPPELSLRAKDGDRGRGGGDGGMAQPEACGLGGAA